MKYLLLIFAILSINFNSNSQTLGGYQVYGYLATAVHPYGCSATYVTGVPDDSIWVNFSPNDSMTGTFSLSATDVAGKELLLETGYHASNYNVQLLLSNGQYSAIHNVVTTDWALLNYTTWNFLSTGCFVSTSVNRERYIVPLDFNVDFGLASTDTVTGIKIVYLSTGGSPDFAGAYLVYPQTIGINENGITPELLLFPVPFSERLNITSNTNSSSEIILYDISSRKLFQQIFLNSTTLNTSQLAKGIYIYEVRNQEGIIKTGKVTKE